MEQTYNMLILLGVALLITGIVTGFAGLGVGSFLTGLAGFVMIMLTIWGLYDWNVNHKGLNR